MLTSVALLQSPIRGMISDQAMRVAAETTRLAIDAETDRLAPPRGLSAQGRFGDAQSAQFPSLLLMR